MVVDVGGGLLVEKREKNMVKICGKQKNVGNICWNPTKFEFRAEKSPYVGRKVRQCTRTLRVFLPWIKCSNIEQNNLTERWAVA